MHARACKMSGIRVVGAGWERVSATARVVFIILVISGNIMKLFSSAIHYSDTYLKRESLESSAIRVYEIIALHEYIKKVVCACQYDLIRLFE